MTMFGNYDSADLAHIDESIAHAKENPFVSSKFSGKLITERDRKNVIISEPTSPLVQFVSLLEPYLVESTFRQEEKHSPERTSKRLYDSHDFWPICLLINKCRSNYDYDFKETFMILPAESLYRVERFLGMVRSSARVITFSDDNLIFR